MFSYLSLEERVPQDHPLRAIRKTVDEILHSMNKEFEGLYSKTGAALRFLPSAYCALYCCKSSIPRAANGC